ncbi:hypothetical protein QBC33DRAFT_561421 [Phialemonium atrogriseum]|uniref:Uncharacterized protein n=1 Tax=Phialemonium atrogriseum TaxID=1093897 RepID=A0AAJ0BUV4_9PEZI|nr:uncharacterized protein QBC33DRAFT_561421 [Phialemonium atrogriseum]KAK1764740.1 hypothetical protein QBC33DRAFT_561421 [Phialemonium atrogriseum]
MSFSWSFLVIFLQFLSFSTAIPTEVWPRVTVQTPTPTPTSSSPLLPSHCTTRFWDDEHSTEALKTPDCYTFTRLAEDPACQCAPAADVMCPMIISVTTVDVPCSTDCCPTTPTATVATCASSCDTRRCTVPTQTLYRTAECASETPKSSG